MRKFILAIIVILLILAIGYFYFQNQVHNSIGSAPDGSEVTISKGESTTMIAEKLERDRIISNRYYFLYYIWKSNLKGKILAGEYILNSGLTIPEISKIITEGETKPKEIRITFPEGWSAEKMSARLDKNGFSGQEFLEMVENPEVELTKKYPYLSDRPMDKSLEGYLFPDTYLILEGSETDTIISKMLSNFNRKVSDEMSSAIESQEKTLDEIITMASLIELEVPTKEDRDVVSGIFWNRIGLGMPLQSSATLTYILGENKRQYSFEDTKVDSPYNTYLYAGLPPGPIGNPGSISINAAIYPVENDYLYFLNNPETGETFFSETLDGHNENKFNNGL